MLNASTTDVRLALLPLRDAGAPGAPLLLPPASVSVTRAATLSGYVWDVNFAGAAGGLGAGSVPLPAVRATTATGTAAPNSLSECGTAATVPAGTHDNTCISVAVAVPPPRAPAPVHGVGEV